MSIWNRRPDDETPPRPEVTRPHSTPSYTAHNPGPAPAPPPRFVPEPPPGRVTIGSSMIVKGEIQSAEDLIVDGQMEGKLDLNQHRLIVGPNGKVRASVKAREVEVQGAVNGNVEATERIIIRKNAKLVGDLKMAGVVIEDGAYFKGSIDITRPQAEKPAAKAPEPAGPPIVDKSAGHATSA